jgi:hypothetical protein
VLYSDSVHQSILEDTPVTAKALLLCPFFL